MKPLAWGAKVSPEFRQKVRAIAFNLDADPDHLMACIAFETGKTFSPSIVNKASKACGLIQFMGPTAIYLGTTQADLVSMTAEAQLDYVYKYLKPFAGKLKTVEDFYLAILLPSAVGKPSDYVVFDKNDPKHPKFYLQNRGLDVNNNSLITKAEAASGAARMLVIGNSPENIEPEFGLP